MVCLITLFWDTSYSHRNVPLLICPPTKCEFSWSLDPDPNGSYILSITGPGWYHPGSRPCSPRDCGEKTVLHPAHHQIPAAGTSPQKEKEEKEGKSWWTHTQNIGAQKLAKNVSTLSQNLSDRPDFNKFTNSFWQSCLINLVSFTATKSMTWIHQFDKFLMASQQHTALRYELAGNPRLRWHPLWITFAGGVANRRDSNMLCVGSKQPD